MKAESIEQIREHLARGGRVFSHWTNGKYFEVESVHGSSIYAHDWSCSFGCNIVDHWELLPIEEELTDEEVDAEIARLGIDMKPAFERLHKMIQAKRSVPIEEEPLTGIDAKALPIVTEDPTGESRRKTPQIVIDGEDTGAGERIRQSLLFGRYPAMNDLRDWWEYQTGERIEWGRRCEKCGGEGVQTLAFYGRGIEEPIMSQPCPACKDHPGYTVRPTWMEEVK